MSKYPEIYSECAYPQGLRQELLESAKNKAAKALGREITAADVVELELAR